MRRRWLPAGAAFGALAVAIATRNGRGRDLDVRMYRFVNRGGGPGADRALGAVTELGSIWASTGAAILLALRGRGREGLDALGAAGTMWLLGQAMKRVVLRPRPYSAHPDVRVMIERPRGTSWPSSHPAVLLAFLTTATRNLNAPVGAKAAFASLAGLVGVSRVYLGVHYPADVVGGLILGRGVADLWSSAISPRSLGRLPSAEVPGTVAS